jgi:hypothetical protein
MLYIIEVRIVMICSIPPQCRPWLPLIDQILWFFFVFFFLCGSKPRLILLEEKENEILSTPFAPRSIYSVALLFTSSSIFRTSKLRTEAATETTEQVLKQC